MWGLTPWDNFNQLSFTLSEMHCLGGIYSPATGQKKEPRSFYFHFFVITLCPLPELHKESFCHVTAGVSCGPKISRVCVPRNCNPNHVMKRGRRGGFWLRHTRSPTRLTSCPQGSVFLLIIQWFWRENSSTVTASDRTAQESKGRLLSRCGCSSWPRS